MRPSSSRTRVSALSLVSCIVLAYGCSPASHPFPDVPTVGADSNGSDREMLDTVPTDTHDVAAIDAAVDGSGRVDSVTVDTAEVGIDVRVDVGIDVVTDVSTDSADVPSTDVTVDMSRPDVVSPPFVSGDLNGDGLRDLVVSGAGALFSNGRIYIYLATASGLPSVPTQILRAEEFRSSPMFDPWIRNAITTDIDLNRDGIADLIVGEYRSQPAFDVFFGSTSGLPSTPSRTIVRTSTASGAGFLGSFVFAGGDINHDGYPDAVATNAPDLPGGPGSLCPLFGTPDGQFRYPAPSDCLAVARLTRGSAVNPGVALGDLDGDGISDFALGVPGESSDLMGHNGVLGLIMGTPTGLALGPRFTAGYDEAYGNSITAADINGDGITDVLVGALGRRIGTPTAPYVDVFLGMRTSPYLTRVATIRAGTDRCVGLGDVNDDGFQDVAILVSGTARIYYGSPTGLPSTPSLILSSLSHIDRLGDFNRDGIDDVIAGAASAEVRIYLGTPMGLSATPWVTLLRPPGETTTFGSWYSRY